MLSNDFILEFRFCFGSCHCRKMVMVIQCLAGRNADSDEKLKRIEADLKILKLQVY